MILAVEASETLSFKIGTRPHSPQNNFINVDEASRESLHYYIRNTFAYNYYLSLQESSLKILHIENDYFKTKAWEEIEMLKAWHR